MDYLLIVSHFMVDWICQPRVMARNKSKSIGWLALHAIMVFAFTWTACWRWEGALIYAGLHMFLDGIIWRVYENRMKGQAVCQTFGGYWFWFTVGVDQMIHLLTLFWLCG